MRKHELAAHQRSMWMRMGRTEHLLLGCMNDLLSVPPPSVVAWRGDVQWDFGYLVWQLFGHRLEPALWHEHIDVKMNQPNGSAAQEQLLNETSKWCEGLIAPSSWAITPRAIALDLLFNDLHTSANTSDRTRWLHLCTSKGYHTALLTCLQPHYTDIFNALPALANQPPKQRDLFDKGTSTDVERWTSATCLCWHTASTLRWLRSCFTAEQVATCKPATLLALHRVVAGSVNKTNGAVSMTYKYVKPIYHTMLIEERNTLDSTFEKLTDVVKRESRKRERDEREAAKVA